MKVITKFLRILMQFLCQKIYEIGKVLGIIILVVLGFATVILIGYLLLGSLGYLLSLIPIFHSMLLYLCPNLLNKDFYDMMALYGSFFILFIMALFSLLTCILVVIPALIKWIKSNWRKAVEKIEREDQTRV